MGIVLDGMMSAVDGVLHIERAGIVTEFVISKILALADKAQRGGIDPQEALNEALQLLPSEAATAVKKLGAHNPLAALLLIVWVLTGISTITTNFANIHGGNSPANPAPPSVINNNITINNAPALGEPHQGCVAKPLKREQARRLKQIEKQREKARQSHKDATKQKCD